MKKTFFPALAIWAVGLTAQPTTDKSFVFGAIAGVESQLMGIQPLNPNEPGQLQVEAGRPAGGWCAGVFGRWRLWKGWAIQPALTVSAARLKVLFRPDGPGTYHFTDIEAPLHLVWTNRASAHFPLRGAFLTGIRVGWNASNKDTDRLRLLRERLALDIGLGVEIRYRKWRWQPEFVYSHGLNNLHDVTNAPYDWAVGRIVRDRMTLRVLVWRAE